MLLCPPIALLAPPHAAFEAELTNRAYPVDDRGVIDQSQMLFWAGITAGTCVFARLVTALFGP